jgi:DNA mismatch repair ATPase MutL
MADLIVDSHLIASYRNRVNVVDAISELIDNSLAAEATAFEFMFFKDKIVALDNGHGLTNLNLLTKLGASSQTGNNVYGVGSPPPSRLG